MENPSPVRKIVSLELHGGVMDTARHTAEVVQHLFAAYQLAVPYQGSVLRMLRKSGMDWEAIFRAAGIVPDLMSLQQLRRDFRAVSRELGGPQAVPGIREALAALRESGAECVIVSALPEDRIARELVEAGLSTEDFDGIVAGRRSRKSALQHIAAAWNVAPRDVTWVGGMGSDLAPVRDAGAEAVKLDPTARSAGARASSREAAREVRNLAAVAAGRQSPDVHVLD